MKPPSPIRGLLWQSSMLLRTASLLVPQAQREEWYKEWHAEVWHWIHFLHESGRVEYVAVTDDEALDAFQKVSKLEGIIPALETSHALAYLEKLCPTLPHGTKVVLNCSGRGDKDVQTAIKYLKM